MARLHYLGGGFVPNIPARDLSAEEVKRFGLNRLLISGLYRDLHPPKQKKVEVEKEPDIEPEELEED